VVGDEEIKESPYEIALQKHRIRSTNEVNYESDVVTEPTNRAAVTDKAIIEGVLSQRGSTPKIAAKDHNETPLQKAEYNANSMRSLGLIREGQHLASQEVLTHNTLQEQRTMTNSNSFSDFYEAIGGKPVKN